MQETTQLVLNHLRGNPLVFLVVAFVAGIAATKTVGHEGRAGYLLYLLVGVFGLFLSQFVIFSSGLQGQLEKLPDFRLFFDFIAAYAGAFIVAAIIHFIKPT